MKIVYDPDKDIVQLSLITREVGETAQIAPGFILDYDDDGQVIGVEIRNASQRMDSPHTVTYTVGNADLDCPQPFSPPRP